MPKKNSKQSQIPTRKMEEKTQDGSTEYAIVTKNYGGSFGVKLLNHDTESRARLSGKFKKGGGKGQNRVEIGGIVMVSFREFEDKNVDIIYVYNSEETKQLKKQGISFEDVKGGTNVENTEETGFDFVNI